MSVEQTNVVDFIATCPNSNKVWLVITDHLEWTGDDQPDKLHMLILQEKINAYLGFIESGEIYQSYPKAAGRDIAIQVVRKYPMNSEAEAFAEKIRSALRKYNIGFESRVSEDVPLE